MKTKKNQNDVSPLMPKMQESDEIPDLRQILDRQEKKMRILRNFFQSKG